MSEYREEALIDTDIILKIGGYHTERLLSPILMSYDCQLYVHEYIEGQELINSGWIFSRDCPDA